MGGLMGPGALGLPVFGGSAPFKTEDGVHFHASDYAYTPDKAKPGTWKLRLTATPGGKPDPRIVGAAVAALGAGFRGQKVAIPAADLSTVKRRVLRAWHVANPDRDDIPKVLLHFDASVDGVAPPGWEHTVRRMKKSGDIDNPFALAWWMKNRGAMPTRHASDMNASLNGRPLMKTLVAQQHNMPHVCLAAARGEAWAQAQLLAPGAQPLLLDGKW